MLINKKQLIGLVVIVAFVGLVLHRFYNPDNRRESFFNILPTNVIDPEYVDLTNETALFVQPAGLFSTYCNNNDQVDMSCHGVTSENIVSWIANDNPRLLNELVLRFDPSADVMNPNHAPRILRLLMMNLPSYPCRTTANKYLPIIIKCFPKLVQTA
jgi:hypothetical protein